MDDEPQLVRALIRRDQTAWAAIYDRHVGTVFGVAFHLVGRDRAVAEDVNQEIWLLAIEQIKQFDPARGELRDWLLGITRHRALRRRRGPTFETAVEGPSDALAPPELLEGAERVDMVRAALLCLRDDRRQVLLNKYADGLSVNEIAANTGRTAKAVESVLSRAREQLRTLLRPYFSTPTGDHPRATNDPQPAR